MNPTNTPQNPVPPQAGGNLSVPHQQQQAPQIPYSPPAPTAPTGRYIDGISPVRSQQPSTLDVASIDPARLPGIHTPTAPHTAPMQHMEQPQQGGAVQSPHLQAAPVAGYHSQQQAPQGFGPQQSINDILPHGVRPMRDEQAQVQGDQGQILSDQERLMAIESGFPQQQAPVQPAPPPAPAPPVYPPLDQIVATPAQPVQPVPQQQYQQYQTQQPQPQPQAQPQPAVYAQPQPVQDQIPAPVPEPQPAPATIPVYQPGSQNQEYSRPTDYLEPMPAEQSPQPYADALANAQQQPAQQPIIASDNEKSSFSFPGFAKLGKSMASVMGLILLVWGGAAVLNAFVFQSYYVDGMSMMPTLQDNDRLIISRVEKTSSEIGRHAYVPQRGHIVVIDSTVSPLTASRDEQLIKRVIGLPGETVVVQDGKVIIKNQTHPDGFDVDKELKIIVPATYIDAPLQLTIPDDSVFVMGDNRGPNGSYDSRAFGPVPVSMVEGRLWVRVLPFDKLNVF